MNPKDYIHLSPARRGLNLPPRYRLPEDGIPLTRGDKVLIGVWLGFGILVWVAVWWWLA